MLLNLKSKLYAIGAAIVVALLAIIKVLTLRNSNLRQKLDRAEKSLKFKEEIDSIDSEIEQSFSHRADEARKDIDEGNIPDHLRNPRD